METMIGKSRKNPEVLVEEQRKELDEAKKRIQQLEEGLSKEESDKVIESLRKEIEEKDKMIREYQDLNQKLFLRIGKPVDEKTPEQVQEEAEAKELEDIEAKIKAHNEEVARADEEFAKNNN